ncbi:hypothetical protein HPO96_33980 [Kribbella sandramycini]|uniref:Tox-REase-2 domain-containing protein n=1 Tax=Kribbella sandramycini TaxID=60450 RepID=A0A7Y4L6H9_9ACTN|nr:restriction endonuclease fold toxin-2 domain-containing protein [Kribbella sandramycini]MBB6570408.1 hypothetical protein [Kribbella sandramycini]NOL45269.1 hypothetical protein [Kribbella sandramycini]
MPSELQRVARGLIDCLDEVPQVVDRLHRTAARCRENAALAAQGGATTAAHQLDAAARSCEAAAHYLSLAPPKARTWADHLVTTGPATNNPSPNSPNRNPTTAASEPTEITTSRKPFEKFHETHKNTEDQTQPPENPLDPEILRTETPDHPVEEPTDEERKADEERADRLQTEDLVTVDLSKPLEAFHKAHPESSDDPLTELTPEVTVETLEFQPPDAPVDFTEFRERLAATGRIRPMVGDGPEAEFQRKYCGPVEYRLTPDEELPRAAWADGLDELLKRGQDVKYVAPSSERSLYRPDSLPPFLRKIAEEKNDHRLLKYREVIGDDAKPVEGLEIITNDATAAAYFRERMRRLDIPGQVTVRREGDD